MLSGYSGASASGLNIHACTASLNLEICASSLSAELLSTTSQPVRMVSAPKLPPPVIKRRRVGSGITFIASLMSNFLSTPGIRSFRMRPMEILLSAPDDHRAQALRHQDRQPHMNYQEGDDQRNANEVNVARHVVAAEQRHQPAELHRLPD